MRASEGAALRTPVCTFLLAAGLSWMAGTKITADEAGKARQQAEKIQKGQAAVPGH